MSTGVEILVDFLIRNRVIALDEKNVYIYGMEQLFLILINIITTLMIGYVFQVLPQVILFICAYIPLRSYAGGYHAKTRLRCYLVSVVMMMIVALLIKYMSVTVNQSFCLLILSCVIILKLAPTEDVNKPLSQKEKYVYKRRVKVILGALSVVLIGLGYLGLEQMMTTIITVLMAIDIMLLLGRAKNIA